MNSLDFDEVREYVNEHVVDFHQWRIRLLENLKLRELLKKNPYLFRAKNITKAQDLVEGLLDARLSSSEERLFWYLISESQNLYTDIIEPIGHRAREHNDAFYKQKDEIVNRFTRQFLEEFCNSKGSIDWVRLVEFNSGNYDLDKFFSQETAR